MKGPHWKHVSGQQSQMGNDPAYPEAVKDSVVHIKQSHDLVVDLATFEGDATLVVLPYDNMEVGHWVYVDFGDVTLEQEVTEDSWGMPLLFTLPRAALEAKLDTDVLLQFVVAVGDRETPSYRQTISIRNNGTDPGNWLPPVRIEGPNDGEIQPEPGGVAVYVKKPDSMRVNDEMLLFVETDGADPLPDWLRLDESHEGKDELVCYVERDLLENNLGKTIRLIYQFAGPDHGLSAQALELKVTEYNPKDASVVTFKQAHDLHIDTTVFRTAGVLLVPPYDDMAAGDQVKVYWALQDDTSIRAVPELEHIVEAEEVGYPLRFTLKRNEFPANRSATMHFAVTPKGGTERPFRKQQLQIVAGASGLHPRLPVVELEGEEAADLIVTPDPEGKVVLVPAYDDMKRGDEVYFHADGQVSAVAFKRLESDDLGTGYLKFALTGELLKANIGDYLELSYQFGRQGRALSSEKRRVDVKQYVDAIEVSHVLCQQAHDRVVELEAFKGPATLVVLPYQGMAEGQVVTVVLSMEEKPNSYPHTVTVEEKPNSYPHTVTRDEVGAHIRFSVPREVLEAGKNKQMVLYYSVAGKEPVPVSSQKGTFSILESGPSLPERLPPPQASKNPLPTNDPVTLSVTYRPMLEGDEVVCYAEGAYPFTRTHRVEAEDVAAGCIDFELPALWLRDNAGWPVTLTYQYARKQGALSSEALAVPVEDLWRGGNQLVHVDQAHDRLIDLSVLSGDATLVLFAYPDMQVLDEVQVISRYEDDRELPEPLPHVVKAEDIGRPLLLPLARADLLAAQGHLLRLRLRRRRAGAEDRDYPSQAFKVVDGAPSDVDFLAPLQVDGQIPTRLPTRPGGLDVTIALDSTWVILRDELILLVRGETDYLARTKLVDQDDLDAGEIQLHLPEAFLEVHLDKPVTLTYQIAREGWALSAQALQATVYRPPVMLEGVLVHFKQAHGLTIDLSTFAGEGILTLLPYPGRAKGDKLVVSWNDKPLPDIVVGDEAQDQPLMAELPRAWLQDTVETGSGQLFLTVSSDGSADRLTEPQELKVLERNLNPPAYLPDPQLETPLPGVIYPLPQGVVVTLQYPNMIEGDEVLFHHYLVEMNTPQWKTVTKADVEKGALTFTLAAKLLDDSVGKILKLRYQFARQDKALGSRVLQLDVLKHPLAIDSSLVHVEQSHDLVIETGSFDDNARLVIPEYQGKAEGDELVISWARLDDMANPFNIPYTVGKDDLGVTINIPLNRGELDRALNIGARLSFSVKPSGRERQLSAVQEFKVQAKAESPPPYLAAPRIAGLVDGKLEPVREGTKVTVVLTSDVTLDTDVILYMNGGQPTRALLKRLSASDLDAGQIEFRLSGYWLLDNADSQVTVFYQYARHGRALSSKRLTFQILESLDPTLPGTVVHVKHAHDQVIDLHTFTSNAMLYVLPHEQMVRDDELVVHWQAFEGKKPISDLYSIPSRVDQLGDAPFVFELERSALEPWSGYTIQTYYTFGKAGAEDPFVSATQTFLIVDNDPSPTPLLPPPAVEGESGGLVYPSPDGAWVVLRPMAGQLEQDESLLFADGSVSEVVAWRASKPEEPTRINLSQEFLLRNRGQRVTLSCQFARPSRALASELYVFDVVDELVLPELKMLGIGSSEATPVDLRTGGRFAIVKAKAFEKGTFTVRVENPDPPTPLLTLTAFTEHGEDYHFAFDRPASPRLLNKTLRCFYTYFDPRGFSADSAPIDVSVTALSLDSLPYLECDAAIGRSELSMARAGTSLVFKIHGWPLMNAGQQLKIVAKEGSRSEVIFDKPISDQQAREFLVQAAFDSTKFFDWSGMNKTVSFHTEITLSALPGDKPVTLRPVVLKTVA